MEPEIAELAKRMREAWWAAMWTGRPTIEWDDSSFTYRLAWVAAAAVARPDLVPSVGPEHWLAPLFGKEKTQDA